jgi:hypothetical protein
LFAAIDALIAQCALTPQSAVAAGASLDVAPHATPSALLTLSLLSAHARCHWQRRRQHRSMPRYTPCLPRLMLSPLRRSHAPNPLGSCVPSLDAAARASPAAPDAFIARRARTPPSVVTTAAFLDAAAHTSPSAPDGLIAQRVRTPPLAVALAAAASVDAAARASLGAPDPLTVQRARTPPSAVAAAASLDTTARTSPTWRRQRRSAPRHAPRLLRLMLSLLSAQAIGGGGDSISRRCGSCLAGCD